MMGFPNRVGGAELAVEDRALAGEPVGVLPAAERQRLVDDVEHPPPCRAGRIERTALDERLERAPVDDLGIDPLGEVPERLERAALLAGADDRPAGGLPD